MKTREGEGKEAQEKGVGRVRVENKLSHESSNAQMMT